jgi:site-specific DNA recombinase
MVKILDKLLHDGDISSSDYNDMKIRIESELSQKQVKLDWLKSTKSPFKVYLNKTLPMIENLSQYWDKADGKTKKKILGCIFTEKFENFNFESCNRFLFVVDWLWIVLLIQALF